MKKYKILNTDYNPPRFCYNPECLMFEKRSDAMFYKTFVISKNGKHKITVHERKNVVFAGNGIIAEYHFCEPCMEKVFKEARMREAA